MRSEEKAPSLAPLRGLPEGICLLIERCLAKDPSDRPRAADVSAEIRLLIALLEMQSGAHALQPLNSDVPADALVAERQLSAPTPAAPAAGVPMSGVLLIAGLAAIFGAVAAVGLTRLVGPPVQVAAVAAPVTSSPAGAVPTTTNASLPSGGNVATETHSAPEPSTTTQPPTTKPTVNDTARRSDRPQKKRTVSSKVASARTSPAEEASAKKTVSTTDTTAHTPAAKPSSDGGKLEAARKILEPCNAPCAGALLRAWPSITQQGFEKTGALVENCVAKCR